MSGSSSTALSRIAAIAAVLGRHGFAPTMKTIPVIRAFAGDDDEALRRRPVAERFTSVLEELGPTFVKLGQILSTRADLLPPDFITCLSRLQDQVPPFPLEDVRRILGAAWGEPADEVLARRFKVFDPTPLASASMAQVHAATLPDGRDVVVKVQRPGIDDAVTRDSELLIVLAQLLERVVEEARAYRAVDLVTEFRDALQGELDFRREGKNLEAFARRNAGRSGVHIPFLVPELSGRTVLVMERIHGVRITELASDPARAQRVVERLIDVAFDHAFVDGLFHGDPHPGNILVDRDDNIAFIDFGLVGQVAGELQDRLLMLLIALSVRDVDTTARLVMRVGDADGRVALAPFRAAVSRLMDRYFGLTIEDLPAAALFSDLVDLSTRFGIRLPRELAILSKASLSIDGIVRALHPRFDPSRTIGTRAEDLLRTRLDPRNLQGGGLKSALQLAFVVQELPVQLGQVLLDFERGQVQVAVRSEALDTLNTTLRGMSMSIFGGILAGALVLAGFVTLDVAGLTEARAGLLAMLAFGAAGGLFGVAFAWYVTGGRLPRVTLRRLFGRRLRQLRDDAHSGAAGRGPP